MTRNAVSEPGSQACTVCRGPADRDSYCNHWSCDECGSVLCHECYEAGVGFCSECDISREAAE